ncbi:HAD family hydrolase [Sulfitobacter sp. JB4-11]|uniref:HAD family hydrolase n=1 Tax=Sulfitobacter rhodophyticola TaxID=3238304 RepID=UPI003D81A024
MSVALTTIGFDADDTLWHNERFFSMTQAHFADLLSDHADSTPLMDRLEAAERRNLPHYGFGIKGFTLSMIETAIEVTNGKVSASVIGEILDAGRDMLSHPVDILPDVVPVLERLRKDHKLVVITKGDLLDQERKLAQSGLRDHFDAVEIVSDKTAEVYEAVFRRHGTGADQGLMVGNSIASDVTPMIAAGGVGVHVPHELTWNLEAAKTPDSPRFFEIAGLGALPDLIARITATSTLPKG